MRNKLLCISLLFSMFVLLLTGSFYMESRQREIEDRKAEQILAVNELEQLALNGDTDSVKEKSAELQDSLRHTIDKTRGEERYLLLGGVCVLCIIILSGYIYVAVLRPFDKMKHFAGEIAHGNFNVPLQYERSNYFGDFTWAFDSMRREITKLRQSEREAIENNKTVIATLSHDIKTPLSSMRAYAEGLEANLDSSAERREKYLSVIMKKCDEVSRLTNDLFLHSLSDLDKLKIVPEQLELCVFLRSAIHEIAAEQNDINLVLPDETIMVIADRNRLMQVCENLINNARKYAATGMDISVEVSNGCAEISCRDYGSGIPDEDMPFVLQKFYRGKNCGAEQGSGLGLYIVSYIIEKMRGKVLLRNHSHGLEVLVTLPCNRTS